MSSSSSSSVVIGSTSAVEFEAVKSVLGDSVVIHQVQFPSAVSDQPTGLAEILEGALFRAQKARQLMPDCCMWIGIENGMFNLNYNVIPNNNNNNGDWKKGWKETAAVIVIAVSLEHPFGQTVTSWSDNIDIPPEVIILAECDTKLQNWSARTDTHQELPGERGTITTDDQRESPSQFPIRSRVEFIANALKRAMFKIYD